MSPDARVEPAYCGPHPSQKRMPAALASRRYGDLHLLAQVPQRGRRHALPRHVLLDGHTALVAILARRFIRAEQYGRGGLLPRLVDLPGDHHVGRLPGRGQTQPAQIHLATATETATGIVHHTVANEQQLVLLLEVLLGDAVDVAQLPALLVAQLRRPGF